MSLQTTDFKDRRAPAHDVEDVHAHGLLAVLFVTMLALAAAFAFGGTEQRATPAACTPDSVG